MARTSGSIQSFLRPSIRDDTVASASIPPGYGPSPCQGMEKCTLKAVWQRAQLQGGVKNGVNNSIYHSAELGLWITHFLCLVDSAKSGAIPPLQFTSPSGSNAWHLTLSMVGRGSHHVPCSENLENLVSNLVFVSALLASESDASLSISTQISTRPYQGRANDTA